MYVALFRTGVIRSWVGKTAREKSGVEGYYFFSGFSDGLVFRDVDSFLRDGVERERNLIDVMTYYYS